MSARAATLILATLVVGGCGVEADRANEGGSPPPASPTGSGEIPAGVPAKAEIFYIGRWNGPDGAHLVVTDPPRGGLALEFRRADGGEEALEGSVTAEGLRFMRAGEAEIAVPVAGAETGVAALAGKRDCLSVGADEAYCRD